MVPPFRTDISCPSCQTEARSYDPNEAERTEPQLLSKSASSAPGIDHGCGERSDMHPNDEQHLDEEQGRE